MVFFTCMHCNESLKKPRVEKHFQFQCRNEISVSCMDCFKDFRGQEYAAHTQCISEAERYGGKNFVPRANRNKGEKKQQSWILVVQSVIETSKNLSGAERNILNIISNHENIPRKKAKFFNFMKSILAGRVNVAVLESVWTKMEEAFKKASENKSNEAVSNGSTATNDELRTPSRTDPENSADQLENENNENLSKEYKSKANGAEALSRDSDNITTESKVKKSKKRKLPENSEDKSRTAEKTDDPTSLVQIQENGVKKSKSKKQKIDANGLEAVTDGPIATTKFDWNDAILKIVTVKGEISLKKLRKKIVAEYQTYSGGITEREKAIAKFDKKIKKTAGIVIDQERVKLAS